MKKLFALLLTITILAVVAAPALGQGRSRRCDNNSRVRTSRTYYDNSNSIIRELTTIIQLRTGDEVSGTSTAIN